MIKKEELGHVNGKHQAAVENALKNFQPYDSWKSVKTNVQYVSDLGDNRVFVVNSTAKSEKR